MGHRLRGLSTPWPLCGCGCCTSFNSSSFAKGGATGGDRVTTIGVVAYVPSSVLSFAGKVVLGAGLGGGSTVAPPVVALFSFTNKVVVTGGVPGVPALGTRAAL